MRMTGRNITLCLVALGLGLAGTLPAGAQPTTPPPQSELSGRRGTPQLGGRDHRGLGRDDHDQRPQWQDRARQDDADDQDSQAHRSYTRGREDRRARSDFHGTVAGRVARQGDRAEPNADGRTADARRAIGRWHGGADRRRNPHREAARRQHGLGRAHAADKDRHPRTTVSESADGRNPGHGAGPH